MNKAYLASLVMDALTLMLVLSLPPIIVAVSVGVLVSIFQALTQIQEQTLSFAVKLVSIGLTLYYCSSWIGSELYNFAIRIFSIIPGVLHAAH